MDKPEATNWPISLRHCAGHRKDEEVSRLVVEGYFPEEELIDAILTWAEARAYNGGVWSVECSRRSVEA